MKIGIDIDDVVVDFISPFLEYYNSRTGRNFLFEEVFSYHFEDFLGCTKEQAIQAVRDFYGTEAFDQLKPLPGALEGIKILSENNNLVYITARHAKAKSKTPLWLNNKLPEIKSRVIYTGELERGRKVTKAEVCLSERIELMLEDSRYHSLECAEAGISTILFDKPWNQGIRHVNIVRVRGWEEALDSIEFISQNPHT